MLDLNMHTHATIIVPYRLSPFYDVIDVESIVYVACLRPMPAEKALRSFNTTDKLFFVNKFAK